MDIEEIFKKANEGDVDALFQLKLLDNKIQSIFEKFYYDGNKANAVGTIILSESVTQIQGDEFKGCKKLKQLILPESLTSIGENAFEGCFRLEKVFFPDNLKSIGQRAFFGCKSLEKIILPDNVSIGKDAFAGCKQNFSPPVQKKNFVYYDGKKKMQSEQFIYVKVLLKLKRKSSYFVKNLKK